MSEPVLTRYRAIVEYDGSGYCGFQRQAQGIPSVQEQLELAVGRLAKQPVTVLGSGRTDSGVHATGQVIGFDLVWKHGLDKLQLALNAHLPPDIAVRQVEVAPANFHPRFRAQWRSYQYLVQICGAEQVRRPLTRNRCWQLFQPLNVQKMNEAAAHLVGTQDFATFGLAPQGDNTVREIRQAVWTEKEDMLIFEITANAFLYHMVRNIVGTLKLVGEEKWTVNEFVMALQACQRRRCGNPAPPHGLYLTLVEY